MSNTTAHTYAALAAVMAHGAANLLPVPASIEVPADITTGSIRLTFRTDGSAFAWEDSCNSPDGDLWTLPIGVRVTLDGPSSAASPTAGVAPYMVTTQCQVGHEVTFTTDRVHAIADCAGVDADLEPAHRASLTTTLVCTAPSKGDPEEPCGRHIEVDLNADPRWRIPEGGRGRYPAGEVLRTQGRVLQWV